MRLSLIGEKGKVTLLVCWFYIQILHRFVCLVGIKKFKEPDDDEIAKKTIMREVRMLRMLKYKNIVTLKEAFKRQAGLVIQETQQRPSQLF